MISVKALKNTPGSGKISNKNLLGSGYRKQTYFFRTDDDYDSR